MKKLILFILASVMLLSGIPTAYMSEASATVYSSQEQDCTVSTENSANLLNDIESDSSYSDSNGDSVDGSGSVVWTMSQEDINAFKEYLKECHGKVTDLPDQLRSKYSIYQVESGTIILPSFYEDVSAENTVNMVSVSPTVVKPQGSVTDKFPPYEDKVVAQKSMYSDASSRNISAKICHSMTDYVCTNVMEKTFDIGTTIYDIVRETLLSQDVIQKVFAAYNITFSAANKLEKAVRFYYSEKWMYTSVLQSFIYDYTNYNRYVSITCDSAFGEISMSWNDVENGKATNPSYAITSLPYTDAISYDYVFESILDIWNRNIEEYGYWKWGDSLASCL